MTERETKRDRERERETERGNERQREGKRDRERERERDKRAKQAGRKRDKERKEHNCLLLTKQTDQVVLEVQGNPKQINLLETKIKPVRLNHQILFFSIK